MSDYKCPNCGSDNLFAGESIDFFDCGIDKHRDSFLCENCGSQMSFINGELEECFNMDEMDQMTAHKWK